MLQWILAQQELPKTQQDIIPWIVGILVVSMLGILVATLLWQRNTLTEKLDSILSKLDQLLANKDAENAGRIKLAKALYVLTFKVENPEASVKEMAENGIAELEK